MSTFTDFCQLFTPLEIAQMVSDLNVLETTGVLPDGVFREKREVCVKACNMSVADTMACLRSYVLLNAANRWASTILAREQLNEILPNGCQATFYPQAWQNDYAVQAGDPVKFDITKQLLAMTLEDISDLSDDSDDSDQLADLDALGHSGPFRVECEYAIQQFFGVDDANEITEEMLVQKRKEFGL